MAKVLDATCENEVVTIEGRSVEATILSEGVGESTGSAVLDGEKVFYIAKTSPDLKLTLEKSFEALNKISDILISIGAGMTGPTTAPPPTLAADVLEVQNLAIELQTLSEGLR